jgi:hypothetical protein
MAYHPESILFVLDVDADGATEAYKGSTTKLQALKQCITICASTKSRVSRAHRFALATLSSRAELVQPFTSSAEALLSAVRAVQPSPTSFASADLGSVIAVAQTLQRQEAAAAQGSRMRVVLLYSRSSAAPSWQSNTRAGLAVDALYIHDGAGAGEDGPQVGESRLMGGGLGGAGLRDAQGPPAASWLCCCRAGAAAPTLPAPRQLASSPADPPTSH